MRFRSLKVPYLEVSTKQQYLLFQKHHVTGNIFANFLQPNCSHESLMQCFWIKVVPTGVLECRLRHVCELKVLNLKVTNQKTNLLSSKKYMLAQSFRIFLVYKKIDSCGSSCEKMVPVGQLWFKI